jgi:hypothetical protein
MNLCSNILFRESVNTENEQFHFYNSLVRTCQRYGNENGVPQIYIPDAINDSDDDEAPIQTKKILQN